MISAMHASDPDNEGDIFIVWFIEDGDTFDDIPEIGTMQGPASLLVRLESDTESMVCTPFGVNDPKLLEFIAVSFGQGWIWQLVNELPHDLR